MSEGFAKATKDAQDYDLALRCIERLEAEQIHHLPRVLYHWRSHPGSTAKGGSEKPYALTAGQRALDDHFARLGVSATAELLPFEMYRVHYEITRPVPLVSLVIPTRNGLHLIKQCIQSILEKTLYPNFEILIVDNNSDDPATLEYLKTLGADPRIRVLRDARPFNFSALNNSAVLNARGAFLGLVNNDIEVIAPRWLDEMVSLAQQPGVGAVGARLLYPNGTAAAWRRDLRNTRRRGPCPPRPTGGRTWLLRSSETHPFSVRGDRSLFGDTQKDI